MASLSPRDVAILAAARRRSALDALRERLRGSLFGAQMRLVDAVLSGQRRTALICGRRAGKSYAIAVLLILTCLRRSDARCIWLGITQRNIRRFAWDILSILNIRFGLGMTPNKTDLSWTFPSGSRIEIDGADNVREEAEKYTGAYFDAVVIDECGSFGANLLDFIWNSVFRPTLMDRRGIAILAGTPRHILQGLFYDGTRGVLPDWQPHSWSSLENPSMREQILAEIAEMEAANPLVRETTAFRREILGEWCPDEAAFVYQIAGAITHEPYQIGPSDRLVIALDPGTRDAAALVAMAASRSEVHVLESWARTDQTTAQIAAQLREWMVRYQGASVVVDSAAAGVIKDLRTTYRIPGVIEAKKTRKHDAIRALNGELAGVSWDGGSRRVLIHLPGCDRLVDEASILPWRDTQSGRVEDPGFDNHMCDALLYGWRSATGWAMEPGQRPETRSERTVRLLLERERRMSGGDRLT